MSLTLDFVEKLNDAIYLLKPLAEQAAKDNDWRTLRRVTSEIAFAVRTLQDLRTRHINEFARQNGRQDLFGIHKREESPYIQGIDFLGSYQYALGYGDNDSLMKQEFVILPRRSLYGFGFLFAYEGRHFYAVTNYQWGEHVIIAIMEVVGRSTFERKEVYMNNKFFLSAYEANKALHNYAKEVQYSDDHLPFGEIRYMERPLLENAIFMDLAYS